MADLSFDLELDYPDFRLAMAAKIPARGITAVMGPSGSGKTTLLRALAGLEPGVTGMASLGSTTWFDARRSLPPRARRIGFVFQDNRLFDHLSVADNIAYGARRRKVAAAAVQGVVDALGVRPLMNRRPQTLSGGEARRVALARAMASGPGILFMDEPMAGLDDDAKAALLPYISSAVVGSGVPVLYVTHAQAEVTHLADRVLMVADGAVSGWGSVPPRLSVTVVGQVSDGRLMVSLGSAQFTVPGYGAAGDARQVVLPAGGVLMSRDHPGETAALAVLEAQILASDPRRDREMTRLQVNGQTLELPLERGSPLHRNPPKEGSWVWLTLLRAVLR
ncbi:MAG: ATP-binding cassette domain-containing protein [Pseudomonadota bacterium]